MACEIGEVEVDGPRGDVDVGEEDCDVEQPVATELAGETAAEMPESGADPDMGEPGEFMLLLVEIDEIGDVEGEMNDEAELAPAELLNAP